MIKNNKGITLIALVITIIVMLVLVAVTVAFAINGGLFKRAKEGSAETEKKAIYDTIYGSMQIEDKGDSTFQVGEIRVYDTVEAAKIALNNDGYDNSKISVEYKNGATDQESKEAYMTVESKRKFRNMEI